MVGLLGCGCCQPNDDPVPSGCTICDAAVSNYKADVLPYSARAIDATAVFGRQAPLVLEIGFGMGQATAAIAAARPDTDFVGVDDRDVGGGELAGRVEQALAMAHFRPLARRLSDEMDTAREFGGGRFDNDGRLVDGGVVKHNDFVAPAKSGANRKADDPGLVTSGHDGDDFHGLR